MRILIAPDKFKESLSASGVCAAIAAGLRAADPTFELDLCPLADGGEGTGSILAAATGAVERESEVRGPIGRPVRAKWWWRAVDETAIIELAQAAGLAQVPPHERDPLHTTTFGVGQLLIAARDAGAKRILLAVGGSATVDGGIGCLQALGARIWDATGRLLPDGVGGGALHRVAKIVLPRGCLELDLTVLADVRNPLVGPQGAATVFGPQKGAGPAAVAELEAGLAHWAEMLNRSSPAPVDFAHAEYLGAAGGVSAPLVGLCSARCQPGFDAVAAAVNLRSRIALADWVITGEGRLDGQTREGKVLAGVAGLAKTSDVPCTALVGAIAKVGSAEIAALGLDAAIAISDASLPAEVAVRETATNLRAAAAEFARKLADLDRG